MDAVSVISREDDGMNNEHIENMLHSAVSAMKLGMYEEALARLEDILEVGTGNFQLLGTIYMYYGRVCRLLNRDAKALEFFDHELQVLQLTLNYPKACDSSRRIVKQSLRMGMFSKAKRCAEDLIEYTSRKTDDESFVRHARTTLITTCLEGYERNLEKNPDEKKKLLIVCMEQIAEVKRINKDHPDVASEAKLFMLEAQCLALDGKLKDAHRCYKECIEFSIKTDQLQNVHRAYYDMALYSEGHMLLFVVDNLRSALFYVLKYGKEKEVAKYKHELAVKLLSFGNPHEAYLYEMEVLELVHQLNINEYLKDSFLIVSKSLAALGKRQLAAYFIVLGSVLTINEDSFDSFYEVIDKVMIEERNHALDKEDVMLPVDASTDPTTPNEIIAKFVVKIEHTTSIDTWRIIVNRIIEEQTKPVAAQKENDEPLELMDLILKLNSRMDDQRTELPASRFVAPRPMSAASRKTNKSHRILPGLRANLAKMQNIKFDTHTVNRLLKRSKKSKSSLHSTSTQGDDTRSDDVTVLSK